MSRGDLPKCPKCEEIEGLLRQMRKLAAEQERSVVIVSRIHVVAAVVFYTMSVGLGGALIWILLEGL